MKLYAFLFVLFSSVVFAAPCAELHGKNYNRDHDHDVKTVAVAEDPVVEAWNRTVAVVALPLLEKRDDIDDWNRDNPDNRIAAYYVCPHPRVLFTVFNARAVYQAFRRGAWYIAHPGELRPRWSGLEHPHSVWLPDYRAQRVDLGRAEGELFLFPVNPTPLGEWPGIAGAPVSGPPGDHRVVLDEHGMFAGVVVLFAGEPGGERLVWCYPMLEYGARDVGATAEGNPGVDEAWRDGFDGHYLFAPDPVGGSRPPGV
ncbi:hypothetical protein F5Y00DRAFT_258288 [Daldinia vernicosa]|uniref:uncharacterized protein n=1 Tax=Daldinia vernicosa TaxID=114800 RepID=UPI002008D500|nr:uncharacterized protein F5Y00DRAFT_258288 [Daldinia vernicosa]KAI0852444.1 hypothetical protein F5Y00DRAFT_258288 [Daldinia vernicosa]